MKVQPYLNFDGRCDEAIEFYKNAVGAKVVQLMRFRDMPGGCDEKMPRETLDKVMHANLQIGDNNVLMSDGECAGKKSFSGMSLALSVGSDEQALKIFNALSAAGKVTMPLTKTFFSSNFGMLTDRFGLNWMVLVGE